MKYLPALQEGLIAYLLFIPLLTFHEWAHAWTAWKLGDDTAHQRGRVSLNPIVHMELLGTVILPLLSFISGAMGAGVAILGWGKPVPVNPNNLARPRLYDCLIAMAGPAMNLLLAILLIALAKVSVLLNQRELADILGQTAMFSLVLCFFNLLPIPPLDGSHLWFNALKMSPQTYYRLAQFGFVAVIILIQFQAVQNFLINIVETVFNLITRTMGVQ